MGHLMLIDASRECRHRVPDLRGKFLLAGPESYPTFYHQLLSFLPQAVVDRFEPLLGTVVETAHAAIVFGVSYHFAATCSQHDRPELIAFVAAAMFALTPLLLGIENHGRVYRLSPRALGTLLSAISFLSMVWYVSTGSIWLLLAAGVSAGIAALASKFAVQAILFISLLMAGVTRDTRFLYILPAGFLAALLISRGHYWAVLKGHLRHSFFYCTYARQRNPAANPPIYGQLLRWPITLLRSPLDGIRQSITNQILMSFVLCPWLPLLFFIYIKHTPGRSAMTEIEWFLVAWSLCGMLAMFLTAIPWLRFLGEASRYVVHSVTPICILCAHGLYSVDDHTTWTLAGIGLVISVFAVTASYAVARLIRRSDGERAALYAWVRQQPSSIILTIDLRLSHLVCFRTPHRAVFLVTNCPSGKQLLDYKRLVPKWYPLPTMDLGKVISDHQVDLIVVDERALELIGSLDPSCTYDLGSYREVYRKGRYCAYQTRLARSTVTGEKRAA